MDFEFKFTPDELNSFPDENKAILEELDAEDGGKKKKKGNRKVFYD